MKFLVNTRYTGTFRNWPAQDFVLLFKKKMRLYDELHTGGISPIIDAMKKQQLQSAAEH